MLYVRFLGFLGWGFLVGGTIPGNTQKPLGPFFGNGLRNGWVDQHSVTIWSRLTTTANLVKSDVHFQEISKEEHSDLRQNSDSLKSLALQIPNGFTLSDMDGACPGSKGEIQLSYWPVNQPNELKRVAWRKVDEAKNHTAQWKLQELHANTKYQVQLIARPLDGHSATDTMIGQFRTPPSTEYPARIKFSVVTGHDYNRRDNPENGHEIYRSMLKEDLDFYVHTGDIEYYDKPNPWALTEPLMFFKWNRLFALPFQRDFYRQTSTYFIKDDHDALSNDCYPGMRYGTVSFQRGLEIFDDIQFPSNDSLYKKIRWGRDLEIWIVEGRNYRSRNSAPDGPDKSIWGKAQRAWLFETMARSTATFKVLITSTPILGPDRQKKNDNYANAGFSYEGHQIRHFLDSMKNTFICTGDRHWQYVSHKEGTDLWEFSCGPGSDQHAGGWSELNRTPEHKFLRVKGGYLTVEIYREDDVPYIAFRHHDVFGDLMHREVFRAK